MALRSTIIRKFTILPLAAASVLAIATPVSIQAHQLANAHGQLVSHQHVYKRGAYGQNFIVGHVAPTRHGHNMIIWSPAPSNGFGPAVPQMHITKPDRQRQSHQQRAPQTAGQINNLRQIDPRDRR